MTEKEFENSLKKAFFDSDDLVFRAFQSAGVGCLISFIDGETNKILLEQDVIRPLLSAEIPPTYENLENIIACAENPEYVTLSDCANKIADGNIIFFISETDKARILNIKQFEKRSIQEPPTSSVLKGPREGFIEDLKTNVTLIRRRLKTPALTVKTISAGRYSATKIALVYVSGIACEDIVEKIKTKIADVSIDGIVDSAYISSFISERKNSIFSQVGNTEKPDVVTGKLLEGRIAIIVDGSPIVLTVPFVLLEDLQDGYDYYSNSWRVSMIRLFRLFGALMTVLLPGAYVALQSYHYHLLPLKFMITLLSATSGIPFPPAIEMLVVLLLFEILNQASLRMPRFLGISLSIVGAIVLGDTAVKAGLISSPAVLVTALSAIGIFCVPDQVGTLSILRFAFLCVSAVSGLFGITVLLLILVSYLCSMESFSAPYLAPYAPRIEKDLKDALFKAGVQEMTTRPFSFPNKNRTRIAKKH